MPAKVRVTREMIVEAAFAIAREEGHEALTVRRIAGRLNCSTQPVLYQFSGIDAIRRAAYELADAWHSEYLMRTDEACADPLLGIGLRYVRFAAEEGRLFRFLFQSGEFAGKSLGDLMDDPGVSPLIRAVAQEAALPPAQAKALFRVLFACVHGWASLLANNAMRYDPAALEESLRAIYEGTIIVLGGKNHEEAQ